MLTQQEKESWLLPCSPSVQWLVDAVHELKSPFAHCTMQTLICDMWLNSQAKISLYDLNECLLCVVASGTEAKSRTMHDHWPRFACSRSPLSNHRSDKCHIVRWLTQSFHPCDCLIQQVICVDWHCTGALDLIMFYGSTIFMNIECHELFSFTALAQILLPHPIEEPIQLQVCAQLVQELRSTADKLHHWTCVAMWLTGLQRRNMLTP